MEISGSGATSYGLNHGMYARVCVRAYVCACVRARRGLLRMHVHESDCVSVCVFETERWFSVLRNKL